MAINNALKTTATEITFHIFDSNLSQLNYGNGLLANETKLELKQFKEFYEKCS